MLASVHISGSGARIGDYSGDIHRIVRFHAFQLIAGQIVEVPIVDDAHPGIGIELKVCCQVQITAGGEG